MKKVINIRFNYLVQLKLLSFFLCFLFIFPAIAEEIHQDQQDSESEIKNVESIDWYDYRRGLFIAFQENKFALLSFCDPESEYCTKLFETTFNDQSIKNLVSSDFVSIKVDSKSNNPLFINEKQMKEKDLKDAYKVVGYPTLIFLDSEGNKVSGSVQGYIPPEKLISILEYISSNAYQDTKLNNFIKKQKKRK